MEDRAIERLKRRALESPDDSLCALELIRVLLRSQRFTEAWDWIDRELSKDRGRRDLRELLYDTGEFLVARSPWPSDRGDGLNRSAFPGSRAGRVRTRIRLGRAGEFALGITVGRGNQAYILTNMARLQCYDLEAGQRLFVESLDQFDEREFQVPPTVDPSGYLYLQGLSRHEILDPRNGAAILAEPAVTDDTFRRGAVSQQALEYLPNNTILAYERGSLTIREAGNLSLIRRLENLGRPFARAPVLCGQRLVLCHESQLLTYNFDGDLLEAYAFDTKGGLLCFHDAVQHRLYLSPEGHSLGESHKGVIEVPLDEAGNPDMSESASPFVEGSLKTIDKKGRLLVQKGGDIFWLEEDGVIPVSRRSHHSARVTLDSIGMTYLAHSQELLCFAPNGAPIFRTELPSNPSTAPIVGPGSTTLLGLLNGLVFVIE